MPNPYNFLRSKDNPDFYSFTTCNGTIYSCFFGRVPHLSPLLGIYDLYVRDFSFYPGYPTTGNDKKKADPRVSDTIVAILREYFSGTSHIAVYICDDSEGRERALSRQVVFNRWKKALSNIVDSYEVELYIEAEDTTLYGGILIHKDRDYEHLVQREIIEKLPSFILEKYGQ